VEEALVEYGNGNLVNTNNLRTGLLFCPVANFIKANAYIGLIMTFRIF